MKSGALARRYAQALLEIGKEESSAEKFGTELRGLLSVFSANPILYKVLLNPMYGLDERLSLSGEVAKAVGVSERVEKFLDLLVETRNIRLLDAICASYAKGEDLIAGRVRATVIAPEELDATLLGDIKDRLCKETGKEVIVSFVKDATLIGGVVIKIGNTVLDGSIKGQLKKMKTKLLGGVA
ncbi:MAG: ATP synthase F1 subunit delta [Deltaproteobacteria bacterium]|nr:ATP synthase F1 subunit delta [Deltaproteobacteria bacterium]